MQLLRNLIERLTAAAHRASRFIRSLRDRVLAGYSGAATPRAIVLAGRREADLRRLGIVNHPAVSGTRLVFESYLPPGRTPVTLPRPGHPPFRRAWAWVGVGVFVLGVMVWREIRTSEIQSRLFPTIARSLKFAVAPGPSRRIVFPAGGPLDVRHGYARIPDFARRLGRHGYRLVEQTRFSRALASLAGMGIPPPYREPSATGLVIRGAAGDTLYDLTPRDRQFARYEDIPPIVVQSITFMEDRDLAEGAETRLNPAVDWGRFTKATLMYAGSKLGFPIQVEGGSTLAIQMEKYRHSDEGRTGSGMGKIQQMISASLRAYREGPDTRGVRREIVLDYLNTMPLAAAPGVGEVHGLKDGLRVWFGMDPEETLDHMDDRGPSEARARAIKHTLALLCAVRAPSRYLIEDHRALEARVDGYTALLARQGMLDRDVAEAVLATPLEFVGPRENGSRHTAMERKPLNMIRTELLDQLGVRDFYDLDQLHLDVQSTLDTRLNQQVMQLFRDLRDPEYVGSHGLIGERLLGGDEDPSKVVYSLMLFESTSSGNLLRVQADNLDRPFDVNRSTRIELGSTAKLRTLVHYLEIVAELHDQLAPLGARALAARAKSARDPITAWAVRNLQEKHDMPLDSLLERALDRRYSANPWETFYTGGGVTTFGNFEPDDDRKILPVREATARSTNLVFIRLMRDLVRYHTARLPYDAAAILDRRDAAGRRSMLLEIADEESRDELAKSWRRYRGLSRDEAVIRFLGNRAATPRELALVLYGWQPGASRDALDSWLRSWGLPMSADSLDDLVHDYASRPATDCAYLLNRHLVDLWAVSELLHDPKVTWDELVQRSAGPRAVSSAWLLDPRHRHPQDLRLRTHIERDAFERMTPYWRRLGFPFARLVPSYATAIGSAADRPAALARLMGILVNDGVDRSILAVQRLSFASETPYYTALEPSPNDGVRVLEAPIARATRGVLRGVVEHGTAQRVSGAFKVQGDALAVGGKTGSGDNRFETFGPGGNVLTSRAVSRTAAFVFYIGDHHFGVITCAVYGPSAGRYHFTSSLPLAVMKLLAPSIDEHIAASRAAPVRPQVAPDAATLASTAAADQPRDSVPRNDDDTLRRAATALAAAETSRVDQAPPARDPAKPKSPKPPKTNRRPELDPNERPSAAAVEDETPRGAGRVGPDDDDQARDTRAVRERDDRASRDDEDLPDESSASRSGKSEHLFDRLARPKKSHR